MFASLPPKFANGDDAGLLSLLAAKFAKGEAAGLFSALPNGDEVEAGLYAPGVPNGDRAEDGRCEGCLFSALDAPNGDPPCVPSLANPEKADGAEPPNGVDGLPNVLPPAAGCEPAGAPQGEVLLPRPPVDPKELLPDDAAIGVVDPKEGLPKLLAPAAGVPHGDALDPRELAPPNPGVFVAPNAGRDGWPNETPPKAGVD